MGKALINPFMRIGSADAAVRHQYIDVLRGVAILGVIAVHSHQNIGGLSTLVAWICNYGQVGVQLFFVASALTLCLSASERDESSPTNFYIRRFFRIAPLYYFGIILYFVWRSGLSLYQGGQLAVPKGYTISGIVENILFLHGFDPFNFNFVVPGGWSIATEVSFYAIFPVMYLLLRRMSLTQFFLLIIVVAVFSFLVQYYAICHVQPHLVDREILDRVIPNDQFGYIYALIINQINVFLIGMATFRMLNYKISAAHLALAAFLIVESCFLLNDRVYDTGFDGFAYPALSAVAFSIITIKISGVGIPSNIVFRALIEIGKSSYSMYIIHFIVLYIVNELLFNFGVYEFVKLPEGQLVLLFVSVVTLTYYVSTLTMGYIEAPGIRMGKCFLRQMHRG
ncbi:acyltransferase family protein [Thioalbus denitrificans]|nr:acyltransferase [Thioalbus denitrificans]